MRLELENLRAKDRQRALMFNRIVLAHKLCIEFALDELERIRKLHD